MTRCVWCDRTFVDETAAEFLLGHAAIHGFTDLRCFEEMEAPMAPINIYFKPKLRPMVVLAWIAGSVLGATFIYGCFLLWSRL